MEYIRNTTDFQYKNTVVALGKFEGLHKGHQLLLDELERYKREKGYIWHQKWHESGTKELIDK